MGVRTTGVVPTFDNVISFGNRCIDFTQEDAVECDKERWFVKSEQFEKAMKTYMDKEAGIPVEEKDLTVSVYKVIKEDINYGNRD